MPPGDSIRMVFPMTAMVETLKDDRPEVQKYKVRKHAVVLMDTSGLVGACMQADMISAD